MSTLNVDKVDPSTGTALEIGTSGDTITVPSGATFVVAGTTEITGTNNVQRPNAQPFIINGDMVVAQRSTSVTDKTSSGFFTCDRLQFVANDAGTWTIIQETQTTGDAYDNGLKEAYRMDCTTADASVAADSILGLKYKMEGFNVQEFKKGTSNAETYTLSFWVKSNVTGTGQVNMRDETNNRMCSATYTTDVTNTWEKKVLNFAADTSGASACTNAEALAIEWMVAAGTDYSSGTAPTAWETIANTDRAAAVTLALSGSTDNDFAITGIQLEVGTYTSTTIPPFQFESYGDNLLRCQRYYQRNNIGSLTNIPMVQSRDGGFNSTFSQRPVVMRAAPTENVSINNGSLWLNYSSEYMLNINSETVTTTSHSWLEDYTAEAEL